MHCVKCCYAHTDVKRDNTTYSVINTGSRDNEQSQKNTRQYNLSNEDFYPGISKCQYILMVYR